MYKDNYAGRLLSAVAGSVTGYGQLMAIGFEMLGNPIALTDKTWKALALTSDIDIPEDAQWQELKRDGCLSVQTVTDGLRDNLAEKLERSNAPFVRSGGGSLCRRMLLKVPINGKLAATLTVVEFCRAFTKDDEQKLLLLGDAASALIQRDSAKQFARGLLYENFIESLLNGEPPDPDILEERIRALNIGLKRNTYVFVFDVTGYGPQHFSITYMRDILEKMISGGQALIYDEQIVIAAGLTHIRDIFKSELAQLGTFLKEHNMSCGISRRCTDLSKLRFHYEQALDALRIGLRTDPGRRVYPYGEYVPYHIAEICVHSGKSQKLCHPALLKLIAFDTEYKTTFTQSLYAYLSNFRNVSKAAASLNLHRNTFVYHIRRIKEIMEIDLDDYITAQLLDFSFTLLKYNKTLTFADRHCGIEKEN